MEKQRILIVDDDPWTIKLLGRILLKEGHVRVATNGADALRLARDTPPDVILLDAEMPGMNGFQVCDALKSDTALSGIPVIFVTSHSDPDFELTGFEKGAADFIAKPVSAPLVLARVKTQLRVKCLTDELRRLTMSDALTGVHNRRRLDEDLPREWQRCRRAAEPIALLMVDIDHFKRFNDRYGHPSGDACLRDVAQALVRACLRPADLVARYGGEEFAILLPNTPRDGVDMVVARVHDAVRALKIAHADSPTADHVTISVGAAYARYSVVNGAYMREEMLVDTADDHATSCAILLQQADRALYAAKHAGRNCSRVVELSESLAADPGAAAQDLRHADGPVMVP